MRSLIIVAGMAIVWLLAARPLSLMLDRLLTVRVSSLPVRPLAYDGGGFRIGELPMTFAGTDNLRLDLRLLTDSRNRVLLSAGGRTFTLGPRTTPPDPSGRPEIDFIAEPGDELSFTLDRSCVAWPTPLEFHVLGGRSPWWRRHLYYRLAWKKRSGAKLEMLWRYEQQHYATGGWTSGAMMFNGSTGLIRIDVRPETSVHEDAVAQYIVRTKGWARGEYRLESRGPGADGLSDVVAVIYLEDESGRAPGGGRSVELYVDRASGRVGKEVGGQ
jgi:hypothetical protein